MGEGRLGGVFCWPFDDAFRIFISLLRDYFLFFVKALCFFYTSSVFIFLFHRGGRVRKR